MDKSDASTGDVGFFDYSPGVSIMIVSDTVMLGEQDGKGNQDKAGKNSVTNNGDNNNGDCDANHGG
ncbi:hypothetical protein L2750_14640 [Shewanella submarina]|uniref:Uncharacterized protein n=1 Tax=Shewanella submarina TaxID=2016376 RepID=A0ABV7G585_9GAMM|nr:hypothetical protein [Shewanella submarina]MCL1038369.1 hypothetical protein [Shewanella submarina]